MCCLPAVLREHPHRFPMFKVLQVKNHNKKHVSLTNIRFLNKKNRNKKGETSISKPIITKDAKTDELFEEKQQVMENDVINQVNKYLQ